MLKHQRCHFRVACGWLVSFLSFWMNTLFFFSFWIEYEHFEVLGLKCVFRELLPFEVVCSRTLSSGAPVPTCTHTPPQHTCIHAHTWTHTHTQPHTISRRLQGKQSWHPWIDMCLLDIHSVSCLFSSCVRVNHCCCFCCCCCSCCMVLVLCCCCLVQSVK